jgi:hypothetical protein
MHLELSDDGRNPATAVCSRLFYSVGVGQLHPQGFQVGSLGYVTVGFRGVTGLFVGGLDGGGVAGGSGGVMWPESAALYEYTLSLLVGFLV